MNKNHVVLELEEYNRLRDATEKTNAVMQKLVQEYEQKLGDYSRMVMNAFTVHSTFSGDLYLDIDLKNQAIADIIQTKVMEKGSSYIINENKESTTVWDIATQPEEDSESETHKDTAEEPIF